MRLPISFLLIALFYGTIVFSQTPERKFVTINSKKLAYKIFGAETRKANEPFLVFESGLGSGGGNFSNLFSFLPNDISGIVYDRNGIAESETDPSIKTDADVIKRLHDLLNTLKIAPPYLFIGHSIGGPFIRLYASTYPDEVSGLVFIDPTDYMLTHEEDEYVKNKTSSSTGYRDLFLINLNYILKDSSISTGFQSEVKRELNESSPVFFKNYTELPPLKNIPVTVLIAYNKHIENYETEMNKSLKLNINLVSWWKELDDLRIKHYADMIKNNADSRVILLPQYSHGIHHQNPQLVAKAIQETYENCLKTLTKK
ncbi:hypothetical protein IQ37_17975 [Chryseobacterium piperi]|uniref:AB hydrolase-1 domain-containing protein n=1 Tax=Chryseobacterium piperi TaxID=558152 RepID=A0A086AHQ0_9FLAO|nr:alpha/beta hydrolase [Chryseobacterium piperi]ASW73905.1 alpha/beta hydrolase [Chryseobacterium piperi]KFF16214.1 hypothetical protein IQ37_17975 [Chryseobacterium piperi]